MRVAVVLGTRPEIIKMSPVVRACESRGIDVFLLHTGQHYSREMDGVFFEDLGLREPDLNLDVRSGPHGAQTARMLEGIEAALSRERVDEVLVQGDTNTVVAGALAATKLGIPVGHVEAGLRSRDRRMPEEINRIVADHVSSHLFAPTRAAAAILAREGIPRERVHVTGNTIVDAVLANRARATAREDPSFPKDRYVLLTAHRQENVDDARRFGGILAGAAAAGEALGIPVVYPIHPRARKMLHAHGLDPRGVRLVEPLDFLAFLRAEANARVVITDSGGVQEEACILGVPCVTARDSTERPETIEAGANVLAGAVPGRIAAEAVRQASRARSWPNPFGDGRAAERIVDVLAGERQEPIATLAGPAA